MQNSNSHLTKETKIIAVLLITLPLLIRITLSNLIDIQFVTLITGIIGGVLIGMLYMHLYDVKKFRTK